MRPEIAFPFNSQNTPFRTETEVIFKPSVDWYRTLTSEQRVKFFMKRNEITSLLGIKALSDIPTIINDEDRRKAITKEVYKRLGNMYGIEGSDREVEATIDGFGKIADGVIHGLRNEDGGLLSDFARDFQMMNEVETNNNPVDLLLLSFNQNYGQRIRFEAKRKLQLMSLAGAIYQKERIANNGEKLASFLNFLDDNVWVSNGKKKGDLETEYILSTHDKENGFACTETTILTEAEANQLTAIEPNQKLTRIDLREFLYGTRKILAYSSLREKSGAAKVLKLLRKGLEYPETAVDDEVGLMGVFKSRVHIDHFVEKMQTAAANIGTHLRCEEISDTLNGGKYAANNVGSSKDIKFRKFFASMGIKKSEKEKEIIRAELVFFTPKAYVDSLYQAGTCHREYEIKRLFDSGVAEWLFPEDIYGYKMDSVRDFLMEKTRREIETPQVLTTHLKAA